MAFFYFHLESKAFRSVMLFTLIVLPLCCCHGPKLADWSVFPLSRNDFPKDFLFGVSSSAYQYEGAFLEDGKGLSNWDTFTHVPGTIADGSTGDVAVDEYHRYKEDIEIMSGMGVNSYRFSLAWSRIFPEGRGEINQKGVNYYNDLINLLIERGIQPLVTLCHYDIPQALQDLYVGFLGEQFADDFARYAEVCFRLFGDRVKRWVTFNEPATFVARGYDAGVYPPGRCSIGCRNGGNSSTEPYIATHNILRAHAKAVDIYRTRYQKNQKGTIGLVMEFPWGRPLTNDVLDIEATKRFLEFQVSWIWKRALEYCCRCLLCFKCFPLALALQTKGAAEIHNSLCLGREAMAPFPLRLHWRLQAPGFFCLLLFHLFRCDPELKSMSYGVNRNDFPRDFLFGIATAAYQYEGAYLEDGKGLSNWDVFTHMPGTIMDGTTGDVADDEYHRYKEDVEILSEMGVNSYRFSIAWSRIFPGGKGEINPKGVKYYNDLIDLLIERRIQPMVTLCHYDLPQALEDLYGGFLGHQFQDDFGRYAETCFKLFGDRVKTWITFNEPATFVARGYDAGIYPPGRCSVSCKNGGNSSTEPYIATHNILCAHAKAVHIYRQRYQKEQQGIVGIVVAFPWGEPLTTDVQDIKAAERFTDFEVSWYLDPLMFGDYPSSMKKLVGERLPRVTPKLKGMLRGTLDFIGVNYYGAAYISHLSACQPDDIEPSYSHDMMAFKTGEKNGVLIGPQMTPITTMYGVPSDVRNVLNYLKDKYSSPKIIITENGFGDARNDSQTLEHILNDSMRVDYLTATLLHISKAIREDGVNLLGYHVWSLLDNFEWVYGYNSKFGLYHVNITSPSLERYPKLSGRWYSNFLRQRNATPTI